MEHLLKELEAKPYKLDPNYEYCEIEISQLRKELLQQTAKELAEGKRSEDHPSVLSMIAFVKYIDEELKSQGWEVYEIADQGRRHELRRLRRKLT